jgi:uncharacterized membrane protein YsdA (DUF1294 family)
MEVKMLFIYLGAVCIGALLIYLSDRLDNNKNSYLRFLSKKLLAPAIVLIFFGVLLAIHSVWSFFQHK